MVTIHFRLSDTAPVRMEIIEPLSLDETLRRGAAQADVELGGYIALREGEVIKGDAIIHDGDTVEVFPALSGG